MRARLVPLPDPPDGLDAADAGQAQVHDDEIGLHFLEQPVGLGAVGRFCDDAQARLLLQHRTIALADDGMIVDQQDGSGPRRSCRALRR